MALCLSTCCTATLPGERETSQHMSKNRENREQMRPTLGLDHNSCLTGLADNLCQYLFLCALLILGTAMDVVVASGCWLDLRKSAMFVQSRLLMDCFLFSPASSSDTTPVKNTTSAEIFRDTDSECHKVGSGLVVYLHSHGRKDPRTPPDIGWCLPWLWETRQDRKEKFPINLVSCFFFSSSH